MKTFAELMKEITAIKIMDSYEIEKRYKINDEDNSEQAKEKWNVKKQAYADERQKKIYRKILANNAECAFWSEYMPVVIDCYNKYAEKRVGDKTKEKIRESIKACLPERISVYIDNDGIHYYIPSVTSSWNDVWFVWNESENKRYSMWDKEGKLNRFKIEMFAFDKTYVEDIESYIAKKIEQAERIRQISKQYRELAKEYNENLCGGFDCADWSRVNEYFKFG